MTKRTFLLALLVGSTGVASAGYFLPKPVTITVSPTHHIADGSIHSARNSTDPFMNIGCSLYSLATGSITVCSAQDATARHFACSNSNHEGIARAVGAIGPSSKIRFQAPNGATSTCSSVDVSNASIYVPRDR